MVTEFKGEYFFLSNYYLIPILYNDLYYPSVEHAYMSAKCDDPSWKGYCGNSNITPADVKRESKYVKLVDNWDVIKFKVMKDCLRNKFEVPSLRLKLIQTGNQNLQEGNYWGDQIWGIDLNVNPNFGENMLGRLLMEIRNNINEELEKEIISLKFSNKL